MGHATLTDVTTASAVEVDAMLRRRQPERRAQVFMPSVPY